MGNTADNSGEATEMALTAAFIAITNILSDARYASIMRKHDPEMFEMLMVAALMTGEAIGANNAGPGERAAQVLPIVASADPRMN